MTGGIVQIPSASDWSAIGVETTLAATLVAVLIVPFFARSQRGVGLVALVGVLAAFGVTLLPASVSTGHSAFFGMLIADPAALLWRQVLLLFTAGVIGIWFGATSRAVPVGDAPEFMTLLISATLGLSLMGATSNLLLLLLAMELASMPSYVLAGFRKTKRHAAEASLKYVLFGAVCTAVTIYGLSLLYGSAGTLDLGHWITATRGAYTPAAIVGVFFVLAGLLFKISAVPAHFWCPDVFEGSHVDVAAFLSVASKGAGLLLLARLWDGASHFATPMVAGMAAVLGIVAVVTTAVGNLGALRQQSVKRILAYSSIAHAGYLLSAMAVLPAGRTSLLAYLVVYAVMNLGAFAVLAGVERAAGSDDVSAFDGLAARSPVAAVAMAVCLVSMVGLPPAAGFLVKWKIMSTLATAGGAWWWIVASVAINSIISLVYYAKILRAMFLRPSTVRQEPSRLITALASVCAVTLVLMLIAFAPLEQWAASAVFWQAPVQTP
ncbi:MAG: proton-translocating NADH-quinone oxidoreductase, chain [Phycisphaerales bacterium]|nr:proton-translocating NADH-quinone oxidoreductase, chain [Phycisphaerales bacterium]